MTDSFAVSKIEGLDHLGLIAAVNKEIGLSSKIDAKLPRYNARQKVSHGNAVLAMILNGLGFVRSPLYLTSKFFRNKPVDVLIDKHLTAEDLTDDRLGLTLDTIYEYGPAKFFTEIATSIAIEKGLTGNASKIDSTSFSFDGDYRNNDESEVQVKHGFSKDHRPDLKQLVASLIMNGPANLPMSLMTVSGNASDKKTFHQHIEFFNEFKTQFVEGLDRISWTADSALYTKEGLLKGGNYSWITRVPETIADAKELVSRDIKEHEWQEISNGYKVYESHSFYGSVNQRWLLIWSPKAFASECETFKNKIAKKSEELNAVLTKLSRQLFACAKDASAELDRVMKKQPLFGLSEVEIIESKKYKGRGRPQSGTNPDLVGYYIQAKIIENVEAIAAEMLTKGRFILATNEMDSVKWSSDYILKDYKGLQHVESGFRFFKDPKFAADNFFLKSEQRIEALIVIMGLCLFIYNYTQHKVRSYLEENKETVPDQKNKPTKKPTTRWLYDLMEGAQVVRIVIGEQVTRHVANVDETMRKIAGIFGQNGLEIYGLA